LDLLYMIPDFPGCGQRKSGSARSRILWRVDPYLR
jgi:hypothetical protein